MWHLYCLSKNGLMPYSLEKKRINRTVPSRSNFNWVKIALLQFKRNQKANGNSSPKSSAWSSTTSSCSSDHNSWSFKKFTSILFVLCFVQEESAGLIFKIYIQNIIGALPNTNNNLRLPAPIFKTPSKSVIGTIPNTNNYLRYPAPIFKFTFKNIIGAIPKTNNNMRHPAPLFESHHPKYYWYCSYRW